MIVNNEKGTFSKKYTDMKISEIIASLEEKFGDLDNTTIREELDKKADALSITASDKVSVVTYNEQGIVTGGKELTSDGSLTITDGVISHAKTTDGLTNTSFGYSNYVPVIKVDEFGHIKTIENRISYSITTAPQAGQVLRGDAASQTYQPEEVDNEIIPGSYHLVTGDAVHKAITAQTSMMYRIMGSCTTAELNAKVPSVGDVWNVTDGDLAGANYVWVGQVGTEGETGFVAAHWDKLSETYDLSGFAKEADLTAHKGKIAGKDQWGHVKTSDTVPLADTVDGSAGTDNGVMARADHTHPVVTGAVEADQAFPASGGAVYSAFQTLEGKLFDEDGKLKDTLIPDSVKNNDEGKGVWGQITGDISAQSDLATEFGKKQDKVSKGTLSLPVNGWVADGDQMTQTVNVVNGGNAVAFSADASVFLNWDPTDYEPYDLGIRAVEIVANHIKFSYPAISGEPTKAFELSAVIIP